MKNIFTIIAAVLINASAFGQAPEKMSYQAVIRDAGNALVASSPVGMQISILQGSFSGTAVYVETQIPTSNANGLVSIEIGGGALVSGDFTTIDWINGPYFVKTETDPTGGTSYTITGTSELLSVPYALHAKTADRLIQNGSTGYLHIDTISNYTLKINNGIHPFYDLGSTNEVYNSVTEQIAIVGATKDNHNAIDTVNDTRALMVHTDAIRHLTKAVVCEPGELTISVQNDSLAALMQNPFQALIQMKDNAKEILIANVYVAPVQQNVLLLGGDTTTLYFTNDDNATYRAFQFSSDGLKLAKNDTIMFSVDMDGVATINDVLKMTPRSTSPASPSKGTIYFDANINKLVVYDGTVWQACW